MSDTDTEDTITSTLRFELIKPLNLSWDDLGKILRALRAPLHRVLNQTVTDLELMSTANGHGLNSEHWDSMVSERWDTKWKRFWGELGKAVAGKEVKQHHVHPRSVCYQLVERFWTAERSAASERLKRGKPYTGDDAIAATDPGGQAILGCAAMAYDRWNKYNKDHRW